MDSSPLYSTRNQSSHLGRTRFRVLRPNRTTREISTQEFHLARSSLRVVPKGPQTSAAAVRNQGFGFVVMIRPPRGAVHVFFEAPLIAVCVTPFPAGPQASVVLYIYLRYPVSLSQAW